MHLPQHQEMLRNAEKYGGINKVMDIIRKENSGALHIEDGERETLSSRVFQHQPSNPVPCARHVSKESVAPLYARDAHVKRLTGVLDGAGVLASEATDETAALV